MGTTHEVPKLSTYQPIDEIRTVVSVLKNKPQNTISKYLGEKYSIKKIQNLLTYHTSSKNA